jgi:hypothetical protein
MHLQQLIALEKKEGNARHTAKRANRRGKAGGVPLVLGFPPGRVVCQLPRVFHVERLQGSPYLSAEQHFWFQRGGGLSALQLSVWTQKGVLTRSTRPPGKLDTPAQ